MTTHANPDFDAICSELAIAEYLKMQKKKVFIVHEKPLAAMHRSLPGHRQVKVRRQPFDYDLAIVLDCAEQGRIGEVAGILSNKKPMINIDHHLTAVSFGQVNIIDPCASSTAEVIFEMFKSWKVRITRRIAEYLYLGILTDTGSFRYQNTTPRTHRIVAELLGFGFSPASFYRMAYEDLDAEGFQLIQRTIRAARYFKNGKIVFLDLSRKVLDGVNGRFDLKDKLFYVFRLMRDVEVIVIFSAISSKITRINFRSTKAVNVAAIAKIFGGGGHKAASGCMLDQNIAQAQRRVLAEISRKGI